MIDVENHIKKIKTEKRCRKKRYKDRPTAKKVLKKLKKKNKSNGSKIPKNVYFCEECQCYHITSMTKKQFLSMESIAENPCQSRNKFPNEYIAKQQLKRKQSKSDKELEYYFCSDCEKFHISEVKKD